VNVRVENNTSDFTHKCAKGQALSIPIAHHGGNYYADAATIKELEDNNRVLLRYCDERGNVNDSANPNGSINNIAGIISARGNVAGMMPHPERAMEDCLGSTDGKLILQSIVERMACSLIAR
jgi:phosphoribosylformylglycinamidine synthase